MSDTQPTSRRTRKIAALAAGVLVVGVGATYTLASWNDVEWVWGGSDRVPALATDTFVVQQNTAPFTTDPSWATEWTQKDTMAGSGDLLFSPTTTKMTPGSSFYAPVALKTTSGSIAGYTELKAAVNSGIAAHDEDLATEVALEVWTKSTGPTTDPGACASGFDTTGWVRIDTGGDLYAAPPLAPDSRHAQTLGKNGETVQHYCFKVSLSEDYSSDQSVQGKYISPAWQFLSTSGTVPTP